MPSIRIRLSFKSNLWFTTLSYFIIYWYCLLFLSRVYTYFLLRLRCLPPQLLIPKVESNCPCSCLGYVLKLCPYRDLNISFLVEGFSFNGLFDWCLDLRISISLNWWTFNLPFKSSGWITLPLCRSKFYFLIIIHAKAVR